MLRTFLERSINMRDLNELIGIFKGIHFDDVVNEKEIARLKDWVEKNKSLVYDDKQAKLINLMIKVLEDGIITQDEYQQVMMYCNEYNQNLQSDNIPLYEFNGIVDGIICDGVINKAEMCHLKDWIMQYKYFIKDNQSFEGLYEIINKYLGNDEFSKKEQENLRKILISNISLIRFNNKLQVLKDKVKNGENIGIDLIDLLDDKNGIDKIHFLAMEKLKSILNSYSRNNIDDTEIIFISLVLIGLFHYDHNNFYNGVESVYSELYDEFSSQKIEGTIRKVINRYQCEYEYLDHKTSRIINSVLENALVPMQYLPSFFEFIYDIYKTNFYCSLPDDLYDNFKFVYNGIRDQASSNGDDLKINVTNKTYKLIKTTKQLIEMSDQMDSIIKLSIIVVKLIDNKYWTRENTVYNSYLKYGVSTWWDKFTKSDNNQKSERKSEGNRIRWKPKFEWNEDGSIDLLLPTHQIEMSYNPEDIKIVITNGEEVVFQDDKPNIKEIIGGYQIKSRKILIEKPLGNITYKVCSDTRVIYSSNNELYRKYLVFGQSGEELRSNRDYDKTAIICCNSQINAELVKKMPNYFIYNLNTSENKTISIEQDVFNFTSMVFPGVIGQEVNHCFVKVEDSEEFIPVYKKIDHLVFSCENSVQTIEMVINNKRINVKSKLDKKIMNNGRNSYSVDLGDLKDGVYQIEVNSIGPKGSKKILKQQFVLDSSLHYQCEKQANEYCIFVETSFISNPTYIHFKADEYDPYWLHFEYRDKRYIYLIPLDVDIYRINSNSWKSCQESMWIDDIKPNSVLNIVDFSFDKVQLFADGQLQKKVEIPINENKEYRSFRIDFLMSYKSSYDAVALHFVENNHTRQILWCYNKCKIDDRRTSIEFSESDNAVNVQLKYFGREDVYLKVFNKHDKIVYQSKKLINDTNILINSLESYKTYKFIFYTKKKGFGVKKERKIKEYKKTFIAWKDLVGHTFRLSKAIYDEYEKYKDTPIKQSINLSEQYITFIEQISRDQFLADISSCNFYGKKYIYRNINPVQVEICCDINNTLELAITKDGDGLLLDKIHRNIMNKTEDMSAMDIYSYSMKLKEYK